MSQFEHPDFSMQDADLDRALLGVMLEEEGRFVAPVPKRMTSLSEHPIYAMLLESPGALNPKHEGSVLMNIPNPTGTLSSRLKAISDFYNPALTVEHWQRLVDQHPASESIVQELQDSLTVSDSGKVGTAKLNALMDKIDELGYLCTYDKESMVLTVQFSEGCDIHLNDTQQDLKNKRLISHLNAAGTMLDGRTPQEGELGWQDPVKVFNRTLVWKVQLTPPPKPNVVDMRTRDYVYSH